MFLELKEVKNLGLEVVRNTTIDVEELGELIECYQCSKELMSDMNTNMLNYVYSVKGINYSNLEHAVSVSEIYESSNDELIDALNNLAKYLYMSFEGKYSDNEELYPKIEFLVNILEFKTQANKYHIFIESLDDKLESGEISEEEYGSSTDKVYLEYGCNVYHEKYLNEDKFAQCIKNDEEIKDDDYIAGFIKLYINPSEQDEITKCIDDVEKVLQESYKLQYN